MKKSWVLLFVLTVLCLSATSGCKKSADPVQAFQSASPENQSRWQLATTAAKTNGYVTAIMTLRKLQLETTLTPDQNTAINTLMATVNETLALAERAGDAEAKRATEEIRRRWRTP